MTKEKTFSENCEYTVERNSENKKITEFFLKEKESYSIMSANIN